MTCARRLAGAKTPASSPSHPAASRDAPRAPEPRPGCFRARLPLLPALALLLGALGVFAAVPAAAQTTVTLSASPNPVAESNSVNVQVTLSAVATSNINIPVALTDNTAEPDDHGTTSTITVFAGASAGAVQIRTVEDADFDDETFTVALGSNLPSGFVAGSTSSVQITIKDLDVRSVTDLGATPGDGKLTVTWTNPPDANLANRVRWRVQNTTNWLNALGAGGNDVGLVNSYEISGLANNTTYEVQVQALKAVLLIATPSDWASTTGTPNVPPATVSLSTSPNPVAEGSPVTVTATLSKALSNAVTIPVTLTRNTSESGDHGSLTSITVAAGATTGTGTISTTADADEDEETFTVALGTLPSSLTAGSPSSVQVTISEGPTVSLSVSPARVAEGDSVTVTATLTEALSEDLTVYFDQSRGTSEPVDDYELFSSLTIPAGRTIGRSGFATKHDVDPDDETFTVSVSHTSYVWQDGEGGPRTDVSVGSPSSVEVTIEDDDTTEVTLEAAHASVAEGELNYITLRFSEPVPLNRGVLNGDPKVTVWARVTDTGTGALLARVPVVVKGHMTEPGFHAANDVDEDGDDERITVTLETDNLPAWMTVGEPSSVTYTVEDAQEASVSLSASPARVTEGSSVTVTATLSNALTDRRSGLQVPIELIAGSAEDGDFRAPLRYIEIPAGATTGTLEVETRQDGDTDNETFTVSLRAQRAQVARGEPSSVRVTIVDDDEAPYALSVADAVVTEDTQPPSLLFAVTLNRAAPYRITVNYRTEDGTARSDGRNTATEATYDYVPAHRAMVLIFEPGETRKVVRVPVVNDTVPDSGEWLKLLLSNARGAALADAEAIGTIYNDDPPLNAGVSGLSSDADVRWLLVQGASNGAGPWTKLNIGTVDADTTEYAVTVPHAMTVARILATPMDGKATYRSGAGGELFAARAGFYSRGFPLAVGGNAFEVAVTAEDLTVKSYRVTVTRAARPLSSNANLSGLSAQGAGADGRWSALDLGAFSAGTTSYAVTVPYGTTQARLTATAAHGRATLRAGAAGNLSAATSGSAVAAAALSVGANAFTVQVTAEDGTLKTYRVTVTREAPPLTASFGNVPAEHDGEAAFAIDLRFSETLGGGGVAPSAASFRVQAGDVAGVGRVSAGLWRVRVQPKNWKDVTVTLAPPSDCAAAGAICTADGRALSNTLTATVGGPVRIRVEGARAKEGRDKTLDFAVTLNRAASREVSVDYATADDTATAGADYTATSGTLTFAAGETAKTVSVPVLDDAVDEGKEVMRLLLSNPRGAYLRDIHRRARGIIVNDDPLQSMWLSRFGRTVGGHIADVVSDRLSGGLAPGAHATLAGQGVDLTRSDDGRVLADTLTGLAQRFGAQAPADGGPFARHGLGGGWNDGGPFARHGAGGGWNAPASTLSSSSMTGREALLGSSFHVADGGEGSGPGLAAWGRAAHGSFSGEEASDGGRMSIDGEALTGTLGADADWGRLLAGVAVSFSEGEGTFAQPGVDSGQLESTMTTVSPYLQYRLTERVSAWGLAGWGTGDMTIVQDAREATATRAARERTVTKTDIDMQLGAIGARGALLTQDESGGMDLALKADAFIVRMESDKAANTVKTQADASRVRLMLEGGRAYALRDGATLRPSLELGLRHDGGDAETGTGLELGGGISYTDAASGLSIDASARMLVSHADSDYEEWGASATVRLDPDERGRGLSFSLSPTIGATSSATERLWGARDARALAPDGGAFTPGRGLTAEAGYGLSQFGGRFTGTPNIGFGMSDDGARDWRIGWRLTSNVPNDSGFEVSLDVIRREAANDNGLQGKIEHGVMLRGLIRW